MLWICLCTFKPTNNSTSLILRVFLASCISPLDHYYSKTNFFSATPKSFFIMATSARSERPDSGDQEPNEVVTNDQEDAQGPESFQGPRDAYEDDSGPNKLDEVGAAGGDAEAKAKMALSKDGPFDGKLDGE